MISLVIIITWHGNCNIANTYACILYDAPHMRIPFIDIFCCCKHVVVCACNNQF